MIIRTKQLSTLAAAAGLTCATLAAPVTAATQGASLSVQSGTSAPNARVRSVRREAVDSERIVAGENETVELLLADGTSITLAPGASVLVDRYRYDRGARVGELSLQIEKGTVRLSGGALNNTSAINLRFPGGTAKMDNGVAYAEVTEKQTVLSLVTGRSLSVSNATETRSLAKAGAQLTLLAGGQFSGAPAALDRTNSQRLAKLTNPGLATGTVPTFVIDSSAPVMASASATVAGGEDDSAKDEIDLPVLDDVRISANCGAGGCAARSGIFDLNSSFGTIGNRQAGRTTGAVWFIRYAQGSVVGTLPGINAPAADYSLRTDGNRNTVARIFGGSAGVPFEVTLGSGPVISTSSYEGLQCISSTDGCRSAPIVNLYDSSGGISYRVAGVRDSTNPDVVQLAFSESMPSGVDFGAYPLILNGAVNLEQVRQIADIVGRPVNFSTIGCVYQGTTDCDLNYATEDDRNAAVYVNSDPAQGIRPDFMNQFQPAGGGGIFWSYTPTLALSTDLFDADPYVARVTFDGSGSYVVRSLVRGLSMAPVSNFESSFVPLCGEVTGSACQSLMSSLFGNDINHDVSDPNYDPENALLEVTNNVLVRELDSFMAVDARSTQAGDTQGLFFATGSVSGPTPSTTATLDTFNLFAGLTPLAGRAFLRTETLLDIGIQNSQLNSSQLFVRNPAFNTANPAPSRVLHHDFALTGSGANQSSTLSVTLGRLRYSAADRSAQLLGRTVGSSAQTTGTLRTSGSVQSPLLSTAVGGGNPMMPVGSGRVGYLVLENYDPESAPNGGRERAVGATTVGTNYASLRVAEAAGSTTLPAQTTGDFSTYRTWTGNSTGLRGYAAGLVELGASSIQTFQATQDVNGETNLLLNLDASSGSVGATISSSVDPAGQRFGTLVSVANNALNDLSAYVGARDFAALTQCAPCIDAGGALSDPAPNGNAAIVSGASLIGTDGARGWTNTNVTTAGGQSTPALNARPGTSTASLRDLLSTGNNAYKHLQWGFFFGDFAIPSGATAHSHLVSWIAGRETADNAPIPMGSATYNGHVLANINNNNQLYSAVGTFTNQWEFATRSGTGSMSLDNRDYSLTTRMRGLTEAIATSGDPNYPGVSTNRFEGRIRAGSDSAASTVGSMDGSFVDRADGTSTHQAVMGQFSISSEGGNYTAVGTFGGERAP